MAELSYVSDVTYAGTEVTENYDRGVDKGYLFTGGVLKESAKLWGSISGEEVTTFTEEFSPFRKFEWSAAEYEYDSTKDQVVPIMAAGKENLWGNTPYFFIEFSTKGYSSIHFSMDLTGTKKAPKNYKLQYSTDKSIFTDIPDATYSILKNKNLVTAFDLDLNNEIFKDQDTIYLRITTTDFECVDNTNPEFPGEKGGEIAFNNIKITGLEIKEVVPTPTAATPTPADPTIAPNPTETPVTPTIAPTKAPDVKVITKKLTLNKKKLTLKKGKSYALKVTRTPKAAKEKLTWKSSKKSVAKVSSTGKVKALKKGKTTITVKSSNGKKATCVVTVKK